MRIYREAGLTGYCKDRDNFKSEVFEDYGKYNTRDMPIPICSMSSDQLWIYVSSMFFSFCLLEYLKFEISKLIMDFSKLKIALYYYVIINSLQIFRN